MASIGSSSSSSASSSSYSLWTKLQESELAQKKRERQEKLQQVEEKKLLQQSSSVILEEENKKKVELELTEPAEEETGISEGKISDELHDIFASIGKAEKTLTREKFQEFFKQSEERLRRDPKLLQELTKLVHQSVVLEKTSREEANQIDNRPVGPDDSVIYFDLDETLLVVQDPNSNKRSLLTQSAEMEASNSDCGIVHHAVLGTGYKTVKALARDEFLDFFKKVQKSNQENPKATIHINIITRAIYPRNSIVGILRKFYNDNIIIRNYYRRKEEVLPQNMDKGVVMWLDYIKEFYKVDKSRIYLIDDSEYNCRVAEKFGFKAIRWPTNRHTSDLRSTFTQTKQPALQALHNIVNLANQKITLRNNGDSMQ